MSAAEQTSPIQATGLHRIVSRAAMAKARWAIAGLVAGVALSVWAGGAPDRYGEPNGVMGLFRGVCRTIARGARYTTANCRDCFAQNPSSVHNLGLAHQIEARLSQDKKLDAQGITFQVEDDGTVVLEGLVPDAAHKDRAASLARDTRGVARVVDHLAVPPTARIIDAPGASVVPVDVATTPSTKR